MHDPFNPVNTLGMAYSRHGNKPFGIKQSDRRTHCYIIGQTGTGKSVLLQNMALHDANNGLGFCLIDPHGDLASTLSSQMKRDHIYWDVSDPKSSYGYNPLTRTSAAYRPLICSGLIDTLKKQWSDSWGARMEHLLRYSILAILETPQADLRDILRIFFEKEYRKEVVAQVTDPQVLSFWKTEFPNMNYQTAMDGVAPIANKLGGFLSHPIVRQSICEPETPLRFRKIMDEGQILIVNFAKGKVGTDIANLIGGLLVSNIANAAFSRSNVAEQDRKDWALYLDEFHAITTDSLADVMSELRKYHLLMTLAQQGLFQSDKTVLSSILANVGTTICFRIGAEDAQLISRHLQDVSQEQLIKMSNYQAITRLMVDGTQTRAFSMETLPPLSI